MKSTKNLNFSVEMREVRLSSAFCYTVNIHEVLLLNSMKSLKLSLIFVCSALLLGNPARAQQTDTPPAGEAGSRACLQLEQEGMARFKKLEARAEELRGSEKLLADRRLALQNQNRTLNERNTGTAAADKYNESVKAFNQQADRLNTDKAQFETDSAAFKEWMESTLQPACQR